MNVFILHNKIKAESYAEALFHLLISFFQKQGFILLVSHDVDEISKIEIGRQNTVLIFHTGRKSLSFFTRLKVASNIKRKRFDYFIQITDSKLLSSDRPQLIISNDSGFYKIHKQAPGVSFAVCSKAEKQKWLEQNELMNESIRIISPAAEDTYQPVSWSGQQALKMEYTQGREYFFVSARDKTIDSFIGLLKAFSIFKKWQHSSMKLVVAGTLAFAENSEWKEKINTYKYRDDVVLLNEISAQENIQLLAGAYACIHFPVAENDILPLLQAMQCETPCLVFATDTVVEYAGESAIVIEKDNFEQLAEKMILLYKDEALRSRLISKGKERSNHYTKEKTFAAFEEALSMLLH